MPMPDQKSCLENQFLDAYLNENLDESEESRIQQHLGSCKECQEKLEHLAGNPTVWHDLRENFPDAIDDVTDEVDDRVNRVLELLAPTDNPSMLGRLSSYEVCGVVGQGSTGVVLKAHEPRLNRFVAIKVLSPTFSTKGAARKRFEREARAVAAVIHENIVPIFAVDEFRGCPYIVMQFIPGLSLLQRIDKNGPLETCEVARIGYQVASGLSAAHQQGVIHRDVKPANVMLDGTVDRAMVTDFGLARVADDASMTQSGVIAGTPQYMSPEQAKGEAVDIRSDLFSLGSLMYAACTARPPFRAETIFGVINRVCESQPRPIRESNPEIEEWLCDLIAKLMSKDRESRFQTAREVSDALSRELAHLQSPTTVPRPERAWQAKLTVSDPKPKPARQSSRTRAAVALALLAGLLFVATPFWFQPGQYWIGAAAKKSSGMSSAELAESFFHQEQEFDVTEEPRLTWRPMEQDWNTDTLATYDQKWEQAFEVNPTGMLKLKAGKGDVVIRPNETDNRIVVTMMRRVDAASQGEAEKTLNNHSLEVSDDDESFSVMAHVDGEFASSEKAKRIKRVLYRVSIPRGYDAEIDLAEGDITMGEINGNANVKTNMGCIKLDRIGGNVDVQGRGGCVDLRAGCGGKAEILCANGDVYLANADQKSKVKMSGGNVWLGESLGEVYAQTSGGDIKVENVAGKVGAYALDGDVDVFLDKNPTEDCGFGATLGTLNIRLHSDVAAKVMLPDSFEFGELGEQPSEANEVQSGWQVRSFNDGNATIKGKCDSGQLNFQVVSDKKSLGGSGLGGSGLGGSGNGLSAQTVKNLRAAMKKSSDTPQAGHFTSVKVDGGDMDGYTMYLPVSFDQNDKPYPILISLQGAWGVGGEIDWVNLWGLNRLIRDTGDLTSERSKLLLDSFIVVSPHIKRGSYSKHHELVGEIIETVAKKYRGDLNRVYLTGLSRGGHGTWGLASRMKDRFAAIVPIAGNTNDVEDFSALNGPAIWIAHNEGDGSFEHSKEAVAKIEKLTEAKFLRVKDPNVADTDYLEHRYVFTTPQRNHHDAWTEMYARSEMYKWLLRQSKSN